MHLWQLCTYNPLYLFSLLAEVSWQSREVTVSCVCPAGDLARRLQLHCTALHYTTLHCTALHCTALHYTTLHYTTLHYTALHCTALLQCKLHSAHSCLCAVQCTKPTQPQSSPLLTSHVWKRRCCPSREATTEKCHRLLGYCVINYWFLCPSRPTAAGPGQSIIITNSQERSVFISDDGDSNFDGELC